MDQQLAERTGGRRTSYQNAALTAIALLLGLGLVDRGADRVATARGAGEQPPSESAGMVSPAEQRRDMIAELRKANARLEAIEARLKAGLSVKVTDMPALKMAGEGKAEAKPEPKAEPKAGAGDK